MALLALVTKLVTRWRHLHWLQNWPPDGATYISCKFGHQMALLALVANLGKKGQSDLGPLELVANLATFHLQVDILPPYDASSIVCTFWSPDGATCTDCKVGYQEAPLASVENWVPKWHNLHWFTALLPKLATSNSCIATLPWIALLALSVSIELVSSSARVTSIKSIQGLWVTDGQTSGHKDRIRDTWVR